LKQKNFDFANNAGSSISHFVSARLDMNKMKMRSDLNG